MANRLFVNVDHVATIRQARKTVEPEPITAALLAEMAGADGITGHLREDRRHLQDRDLRLLREVIKVPLNLEMAPVSEMVQIALKTHPTAVTLVPERREEVTTEGGLKLTVERERLVDVIARLKEAGIVVSLFIDPAPHLASLAAEMGANCIEINTGLYASAGGPFGSDSEFDQIAFALDSALGLGLKVNVGHGLTYHNVQRIASLSGIAEFNIGHSIVARAVFVGFFQAVKEMLALLAKAEAR